MATKSQLVSDIILRITKGKPADDLELEPKQVAFWIQIALDGMVSQYLNDRVLDAERIPDFYVLSEKCKSINKEQVECVEEDDERMYIELKKPVLELFGDKAILRVKTNDGTTVYKARLNTIDFIENLEFAKPSTKNLVYYRDGKKRLIIMGIPPSMKDVVEIFVWYVPQTNIECFDDDEELPISNDMLEELLVRVEEIARRQMFGVADVENDGEDDLPNVING